MLTPMRRILALITAIVILIWLVGLAISSTLTGIGLIGLVLWIGVLGIGYSVAIAVRERRQERIGYARLQCQNLRAHIDAAQCPTCGYSLVGNLSGTCPECGAEPYVLLRQAAEEYAQRSPDALAICNVGFSYAWGPESKRDLIKAMTCFDKASELGCTVAMCAIGSMYFHGDGVPRNLGQAKEWYRKAADLGDQTARAVLAAWEDVDSNNAAVTGQKSEHE
jgi:TPR repeat protein